MLPPEVLRVGALPDGNWKRTPLGSVTRTQGPVNVLDAADALAALEPVLGPLEAAWEPQADTASASAATAVAIRIRIATPYCS